MTKPSLQAPVGTTFTLVATVTDDSGNPITNAVVTIDIVHAFGPNSGTRVDTSGMSAPLTLPAPMISQLDGTYEVIVDPDFPMADKDRLRGQVNAVSGSFQAYEEKPITAYIREA